MAVILMWMSWDPPFYTLLLRMEMHGVLYLPGTTQHISPLWNLISRDGLSAQESQLLDEYYQLNQAGLVAGALTGDLLFPWSSSQNSWRFSPYGFHEAGFQSLGMEPNAEAIDLLPFPPLPCPQGSLRCRAERL